MNKYSTDVSNISSLGVEAHGIELFNKDLTDKFYNAYIPMTANSHGNGCIVTPK